MGHPTQLQLCVYFQTPVLSISTLPLYLELGNHLLNGILAVRFDLHVSPIHCFSHTLNFPSWEGDMYKVLGSSLLKDEGEVVGGTQPLQWECFKQLQSHWHPISKASHLKESDWGTNSKDLRINVDGTCFLPCLGAEVLQILRSLHRPNRASLIWNSEIWYVSNSNTFWRHYISVHSSFRFWSSLDFQIRETPFTFEALMHLEIKISTIWAKVMRDKIKISYYF